MKNMLYRFYRVINFYLYKYYFIPKYFIKTFQNVVTFKIFSIQSTANELLHTNKSLARFGDGEIRWILNEKSDMPSFEKNSKSLRKRLIQILNSNDEQFMIGMPDAFTLNKNFVSSSNFFWKRFIIQYSNKFCNYLNKDKQYYNTSVSRPYIDYNNRQIAKNTFNLWKKTWKNKNILIIEGNKTRLGVGDDLFNNAKSIKRIECPSINAFESYNEILNFSLDFLNEYVDYNYLTLISLGPTATILAYDLFKHGNRAIDVGHIDIEYEWYLLGAKEKIDLPYKYVNETPNGHYALPVFNKKYSNEIVKNIN